MASDDSVEADDLLGSYAAAEVEAGGQALIFTGDRDLFQCAGKGVRVLLAARGGPQLVDAKEVKRRYGVPPELVPDFIALRGDPSDGLPGAKGVGEKTAADILKRHGSLEAALDAAAEGTSLAGAREELLAFKDIATLRRLDVEVPAGRRARPRGGSGRGRASGHEPPCQAPGLTRVRAREEDGRPTIEEGEPDVEEAVPAAGHADGQQSDRDGLRRRRG